MNKPLLQYPDFSQPFNITTGASNIAIGDILTQRVGIYFQTTNKSCVLGKTFNIENIIHLCSEFWNLALTFLMEIDHSWDWVIHAMGGSKIGKLLL